ncbi:MAG: YfhO family protein [Bacteroidales bacterium]|jgi:hypothetical protein|nr:YfhO family protein [Bacteroidales bacterium]
MEILKKILPHVAAVIIFLLVSVIYFSPVMDGKRIRQSDLVQASGALKEVADFRAATGEEALWTNSMFGGMPAYQISVAAHHNWSGYLQRILALGLPSPVYFLFMAFIGCYVMLLCFKVNTWLSVAGTLAYGLSAYFLIIIGVGHSSKMRALAFMPAVIGGIYMVYRREKTLTGAVITCLALALEIRANHFQITYYLLIMVLLFILFEWVRVAREKLYANFIKGSATLLLALVLACGVNITNMLLTVEYTPYSTRGASELSNTDDDGDKTGGLDKSYILNNYSYGIVETMNLFIPNFVGGPSVSEVSHNSPFYKTMTENGISRTQAAQVARQVPLYWGGQDGGTSGPVYVGAVVVFLFVLGLFVVKGSIKWWLVVSVAVSIVLSWGKHCMFISELFIDYFPGYNKFRTVSMILVIAELAMPLLGILALKEMFGQRLTVSDKKNALKKALYITGGIALFFTLLPGLLFDFSSPSDGELAEVFPEWLIASLPDTRKYVLRMDALRSLFFVAASAAVLWCAMTGKLKTKASIVLFAILILVDLWTVDKRYLNDSHFTSTREVANSVQPSVADLFILQDTTPDYRVLNLANPFNDATTSYFHKSIGGYHGAKMKRYQELIDHRLILERHALISGIQSAKTTQDVETAFKQCTALNMLNTRYVIYNPEQPALNNPKALGNAWTVGSIRWVDNADAEIAALTEFSPAEEAVVDKRFESVLTGFAIQKDSIATIRLTAYAPNHLTYAYSAQTPQFVVFSEIYYDKGWQAYIDGQPAPHVRANYVLRAMVVPAGTHHVEFRFAPRIYAIGENISLASSIAMLLFVLSGIVLPFARKASNKKYFQRSPHRQLPRRNT